LGYFREFALGEAGELSGDEDEVAGSERGRLWAMPFVAYSLAARFSADA